MQCPRKRAHGWLHFILLLKSPWAHFHGHHPKHSLETLPRALLKNTAVGTTLGTTLGTTVGTTAGTTAGTTVNATAGATARGQHYNRYCG